MKVLIKLKKNINDNIQEYYDKVKKAQKKLEGLDKAIIDTKAAIVDMEEKQDDLIETEEKIIKRRKRKWFEKFHWVYTSTGFLVIGGRDAKSNETIVKKHMEDNDIYLHTNIAGSPSTVIKSEGKKIDDKTIEEASVLTAAFSTAWKGKIGSIDVYWVTPDQVSKDATSGEYLQTGSFMIRGKRNYLKGVKVEISVGAWLDEDENIVVMSGHEDAVSKKCDIYFTIQIGTKKKSDVAKELKNQFVKKLKGHVELDDIISVIPTGFSKIKKTK